MIFCIHDYINLCVVVNVGNLEVQGAGNLGMGHVNMNAFEAAKEPFSDCLCATVTLREFFKLLCSRLRKSNEVHCGQPLTQPVRA